MGTAAEILNAACAFTPEGAELADELRSLHAEYVETASGNWKDRCAAVVPIELAEKVCAAMMFIGGGGAIICRMTEDQAPYRLTSDLGAVPIYLPMLAGCALVFSRGYYVNIGA